MEANKNEDENILNIDIFIAEKAYEYNMSYSDVESVYNQYGKTDLFHEKLKERIRNRVDGTIKK